MRLRIYGATDKGLVRSSNQDAYFCSADYGFIVVSDGMGGHRGGEIASELTVLGLKEAYLKRNKILVEDVSSFLDEVLQKINTEIFTRSQNEEDLRGMGATVNYLQFASGYLAIGHAGDSRTYLIRTYQCSKAPAIKGFWQLTVDHNVDTFIRRGLLVPGRDFPSASLNERLRARLTRGMGVVKDLKADLYAIKVCHGDVFLTCTDGLHGMAPGHEILDILFAGPIAEAPLRLIALAKKHGGADNVTVVVSLVSDQEEPLRAVNQRITQGNRAFMVRKPNGEILGLMSLNEFLSQWQTGDIPAESELSCGQRDWIFLADRNNLCEAYPELNTPIFSRQLDLLRPLSHEALTAHMPQSARPRAANKSNTRLTVVLIFCVFVIFFLFVYLFH